MNSKKCILLKLNGGIFSIKVEDTLATALLSSLIQQFKTLQLIPDMEIVEERKAIL